MSFLPDSKAVDEIRASPNHEPRKGGAAPDMLVLHYTGMADAGEALAWLCDPDSKVSCHYFLFEDGRCLQLVPEGRRAWHAGLSSWQGETDINSCSIGIEIANPGHDFGYPDFPEPQMAALEALCRDIAARRAIMPARVLGHSDVAPLRKADPGEKFDWARLARAGVGLHVEPAPIREGRTIGPGDEGEEVAALQHELARMGYGLEQTGCFAEETRAVVTAFQRHFRPARVDGIADSSTIATLKKLLHTVSQ